METRARFPETQHDFWRWCYRRGEEKQEEEPELGRAHSSLTGMMAAINSELRAGWGF